MKKLRYYIFIFFSFFCVVTKAQTCTNTGELYINNGVLFGCIPNGTNSVRPIAERTPYTQLPASIMENGEMQYVAQADGVLYRQGNTLYKVANEGFNPIALTVSGDKTHEIGKIIYHTDGHFYEGVQNGRWVQIDNTISNLDILPSNLAVDYPAGNHIFVVDATVNWNIIQLSGANTGISFSPNTGNNSTKSTMFTYPENAGTTNIVRTFRIRNTNQTSMYKDFTVTQYYRPYFAHTNMVDVYGKEQSGTIPDAYRGKVNPGPERFFLWASSNWDFRVRIKYNNAPPAEGYTYKDAVNGDYDYELKGNAELWAYEYQLKENRTGADRTVNLEISFKRMDGTWDPWQDLNIKNSNDTNVTQSYIKDFARRKWSERYAGATENSQDVAYVYRNTYTGNPTSYYNAQFGTEVTNITDNHTLIQSYSQEGAGNGAGTWKLPTDTDLQDLKTAGFIPNRPFTYTGNNSRIPASVAPYNNWLVTKADFMDTTVKSANKIGYGNAFYLYDKNEDRVIIPENGASVYTSNQNGNSNQISYGIHILGSQFGNRISEYNEVPRNDYFGHVGCVMPSTTYREPTRHLKLVTTNYNASPLQNGTIIRSTIIAGQYREQSSTQTDNTIASRTCTPARECGTGIGVVIGPWAPFSCTAWEESRDVYWNSTTQRWTYRLVHD